MSRVSPPSIGCGGRDQGWYEYRRYIELRVHSKTFEITGQMLFNSLSLSKDINSYIINSVHRL